MRLTGNGDGFQAPANAEERNNKPDSKGTDDEAHDLQDSDAEV